ncbi:MAG: ABC transporter substrate-binding protein [Coriobacteriia bacterium]|jgi:ABC-type amino acid transport/signal transduction systems, periplasmic component/domain
MKNRNRIVWLLGSALLIAALVLGGCAPAENEESGDSAAEKTAATDQSLATVKDRGKLLVGTAPFYAPFESTNESTKEIEGFDVDMMTEIAKRMGVEVEFVSTEWPGLLGGLEKGDFDVIVSAMSKKEAAEGNVEFSDVYYELPDVIIVASGNPKNINTKDDLTGKVVGVQTASGSEILADELNATVGFKELKKYDLTQDAMNDLKAGRIDAVLAGQAFAIEQSQVDPSFEVGEEPLTAAELVAVFKKGSTSLVEEFNKQFAAIKADGTYDALIEKWLTVK